MAVDSRAGVSKDSARGADRSAPSADAQSEAPASAAVAPRWAAAVEVLDLQQHQHLCAALRVQAASDLGAHLQALSELPLKQLRTETLAAGVSAEELMDALDEAEDRAGAMIELILAASLEAVRSCAAVVPTEEEGVPPSDVLRDGEKQEQTGRDRRTETDGDTERDSNTTLLDDAETDRDTKRDSNTTLLDDAAVLITFYRAHEPALATQAQYEKISRGFKKKAAKMAAHGKDADWRELMYAAFAQQIGVDPRDFYRQQQPQLQPQPAVTEEDEPHSPVVAQSPPPQQQQSPRPPAPAPILNAHFYAEPYSEGDDYTVAKTVHQLRSAAAEKRLLGSTQIWIEGWAGWRPLWECGEELGLTATELAAIAVESSPAVSNLAVSEPELEPEPESQPPRETATDRQRHTEARQGQTERDTDTRRSVRLDSVAAEGREPSQDVADVDTEAEREKQWETARHTETHRDTLCTSREEKDTEAVELPIQSWPAQEEQQPQPDNLGKRGEREGYAASRKHTHRDRDRDRDRESQRERKKTSAAAGIDGSGVIPVDSDLPAAATVAGHARQTDKPRGRKRNALRVAETELTGSAAHTTSEAPAATTVQLSLEQRIVEFLAGVPIGSPGATGATSARVYDPTALIAFAVQLGLEEESADVIYKQFVDARVAAAETPTPMPDVLELEPELEPEPDQTDYDSDDDTEGQVDQGGHDQHLPRMLTPADDRWVKDATVLRCELGFEKATGGPCGHVFGNPALNRWRRHHCRSCGNVFCERCSARKLRMRDPRGLIKMARVCEGCYDRHINPSASAAFRSSTLEELARNHHLAAKGGLDRTSSGGLFRESDAQAAAAQAAAAAATKWPHALHRIAVVKWEKGAQGSESKYIWSFQVFPQFCETQIVQKRFSAVKQFHTQLLSELREKKVHSDYHFKGKLPVEPWNVRVNDAFLRRRQDEFVAYWKEFVLWEHAARSHSLGLDNPCLLQSTCIASLSPSPPPPPPPSLAFSPCVCVCVRVRACARVVRMCVYGSMCESISAGTVSWVM